jgi:hypothetical protein
MGDSIGGISAGMNVGAAAPSMAVGSMALGSAPAGLAGAPEQPSSIVTLSGLADGDGALATGAINATRHAASPYADVQGLVSPLGAAVQLSSGGADGISVDGLQSGACSSICSAAEPAMKAIDSLADLLILLLVIQMMDAVNHAGSTS